MACLYFCQEFTHKERLNFESAESVDPGIKILIDEANEFFDHFGPSFFAGMYLLSLTPLIAVLTDTFHRSTPTDHI